jgi:hypothetical protein
MILFLLFTLLNFILSSLHSHVSNIRSLDIPVVGYHVFWVVLYRVGVEPGGKCIDVVVVCIR